MEQSYRNNLVAIGDSRASVIESIECLPCARTGALGVGVRSWRTSNFVGDALGSRYCYMTTYITALMVRGVPMFAFD